MINHYRNFLIVKTVNKNRGLIICTDDEYNSILSGAQDYTLPQVIYALDLFQDTLVKIKGGANSRIEMEMSFIKLCEPKLDSSVESILSRLSQVENAVRRGISSAPQAPQAAESAHARQVPEPKKKRLKAQIIFPSKSRSSRICRGKRTLIPLPKKRLPQKKTRHNTLLQTRICHRTVSMQTKHRFLLSLLFTEPSRHRRRKVMLPLKTAIRFF